MEQDQEQWLQELQNHINNGGSLADHETLDLIERLRDKTRLADAAMAKADEIFASMGRVRGPLRYARLQFDREAKFKHGYRPEDERFLRGFDALNRALDDPFWGPMGV